VAGPIYGRASVAAPLYYYGRLGHYYGTGHGVPRADSEHTGTFGRWVGPKGPEHSVYAVPAIQL
jgi:hypothetical protein